jgi:hemerythrin
MSSECLPFGRDLDEIATSTDNRSMKEIIIDWLKTHIDLKQSDRINFDYQKQTQEPVEK